MPESISRRTAELIVGATLPPISSHGVGLQWFEPRRDGESNTSQKKRDAAPLWVVLCCVFLLVGRAVLLSSFVGIVLLSPCPRPFIMMLLSSFVILGGAAVPVSFG